MPFTLLVTDTQPNMWIKVYHKGKLLRRLEAHSDSTVAELKRKIQAVEKIPIEQQTMVFRDYLLEDKKQLSLYDLHDQAVVFLYLCIGFNQSFMLKIEAPDKKILCFRMSGASSVADVKRCVEELTGLDCDSYSLVFKYKILEEKHHLRFYDLNEHSVLKIILNSTDVQPIKQLSRHHGMAWMTFITPQELPIVLNVVLNAPMTKTINKLAKMMGIHRDDLHFNFNGALLDIKKSFSAHQIVEGDIIYITRKVSPECLHDTRGKYKEEENPIQLIIQTAKGELLEVNTSLDTTFGQICQRLEEETFFKPIILVYNKCMLRKRETPRDYNMENGDEIFQY